MKAKAVAVLTIIGLLAFAQTLSAQEKEKKKRGPGGRVKSVDASANTLTVSMRERGKDQAVDKTYKVAKDCKVSINGESKTLADVKADMFVTLTVGANDEVTEIRSVMRKKKENT
jgi:hypothetical protein